MKTDQRLRLYCFPFAGAGALAFRSWDQFLPADVRVCPVELPGRGRRMREPLFTRLEPLVESIAKTLEPELDRPYAFFGHSMGTMVSFELARSLRDRRLPLPRHMFVSGHRAPQIPRTSSTYYDLPEEEFMERLSAMGGMDNEMMQDRNFMSFVLPIMRADLEACQTYQYQAGAPLPCPITAFGGTFDETVSASQLEAWREQTESNFESYRFAGDHFFIRSHQASVLRIISQQIAFDRGGGLQYEPRPIRFADRG